MVESKKEWSFNLERAGAKDSLKEPYGSKQDTMDVVVRSAQKGSTTQFEVYEKKAWDFAKAPLGQLPMFLFIFWMTGSSLSIYTIMFTVQMVSGPFSAIFNVNKAFEPFEFKGLNLTMPKLVYLGCNFVSIALSLYKFSSMGIIPVQPADWAGLFHDKVTIEVSQVIVPPSLQ